MKTLSFHNLSAGWNKKNILVDAQDISFQSGLQLLVAPNGFGKTTLFKTIAGMMTAVNGEVRLCERRLDTDKQSLYVSEYLNFPKFIYPDEWIDYVSRGATKSSYEDWFEKFCMSDKRKSYLGRMSQGERRKLTWIAAEASKAEVLLLDEPFDGLDLLALDVARKLLKKWTEEGRIVCIASHQFGDFVDMVDRMYLIRKKNLTCWDFEFKQISVEELHGKIMSFYA